MSFQYAHLIHEDIVPSCIGFLTSYKILNHAMFRRTPRAFLICIPETSKMAEVSRLSGGQEIMLVLVPLMI